MQHANAPEIDHRTPRGLAPVPPALPPGGLVTLMAPRRTPPTKRWRVAYLVSHPIQYQAPLLRWLTEHSQVDVTALFLSDLSVGRFHDEGFGTDVDWSDVDLLEGYPHRFLPAVGRTDRVGLWRPFTRGIGDELDRGDYDALWIHGYAHQANLRALRAARKRGLPVLLRGESMLLGRRESGFGPWLRDRMLPHVLDRVDAALAIGSANREFYLDLDFVDECIYSAPYAVDNERFRAAAAAAAPRREQLRAELGLDPERPVALFAAKLSDRKRPLDAIRAVARLAADPDRPTPYLLLAGDGPQRDEVRRAARAAERRTGVDLFRRLGFQSQTQLPALYDLCDTLVLPSSYEPWGLVVNEAMNAARPAVVSDRVGSGLDLVVDGRTGARFPHGNVGALADALAGVLRSRKHARALGRQAAERITRFDFAAVARGLESALEDVVQPG